MSERVKAKEQEIKWIKFRITGEYWNEFENMLLRPNGDTLFTIWMQIQALCAKMCPDGYLRFRGIPYTLASLSWLLHREATVVADALEEFRELKMIDFTNDLDGPPVMFLPGFYDSQIKDYREGVDFRAKESSRKKINRAVADIQGAGPEEVEDVIAEKREKLTDTEWAAVEKRLAALPAPEKTAEKTPAKADDETGKQVDAVIDGMNEILGTSYRKTTASTRKAIRARLGEGYSVEDMLRVVKAKKSEWAADEKMKRYLTPDTLFRPSNFEKYFQNLEVASDDEAETVWHAVLMALNGADVKALPPAAREAVEAIGGNIRYIQSHETEKKSQFIAAYAAAKAKEGGAA